MTGRNSKIIKYNTLSGFVLGNDAHIAVPGEQWAALPELVCVYRDLDIARRILRGSHNLAFELNPAWTTIYRVDAKDITCFIPYDEQNNGALYTYDANKIQVRNIVHYEEPNNVARHCAMMNDMRKIARKAFFEMIMGRGAK